MYKYITILATCLVSASIVSGNQISEDQQQFIAKYKNQKNIIPPEQALINTEAEPDISEGFVSLYNGKDLNNWTVRGGRCTFEARGEAIVGTCVKGSPSTYLSTNNEDFEDFIFTAEMKWEVDGNSGIMFRSQRKPGEKFETVFGPQMEMEGFEFQKGLRGWSGGIYGQGYSAWIYPLWLDAHAQARKALKKGEWNRVTIKAVGNNVKTWVNGVPAAHWEDDQFLKGYFALQIHAGGKGEVHFRNIKVKELSDIGKDLFASGDFSAWTNTKGGAVNKGWSIENGVVHRGGLRPGDIITKQHYHDFDLNFDWKISEGGNSGVKYRTKGSLGLEYQILDDTKHKDSKNPTHRVGSLYELVAAPDSKPVNSVGDWNHSRVIAKGNRIQHWLNGEKVVDIEYGSDDWQQRFQKSKYSKHEGFGSWSGPILLQDHNDKVWYRNVQIREL